MACAAVASFAGLLWDTGAHPALSTLSRTREGPSPTKPHDTALAAQTSAACLKSLTNRALVVHKQLQNSPQILLGQSSASC